MATKPTKSAPAADFSEVVSIAKTTETFEQAVEAGKAQIEQAVKASAAVAEKVFGLSKERFEAVAKGYEDLAATNHRNLAAFVAAGSAAVQGVEELNAELVAFTKAQVDTNIGQVKALTGVKTLKDLVDLQSEFVRLAFSSYVQAGSKLGELSAKVAHEAFEPITTELRSGMTRFAKAAA